VRSFAFLVNPHSGGGAAPAAVVPVARLLRDAGAEVEVTYSPGVHAAAELVAAAALRGDIVVAVGGDGMLSSVAGHVSRSGAVLGLVPAGRGNDFVRMLELDHATPHAVAQVLLEGTETPTDLISLTLPGREPQLIAGSVYCGVDAHAAALVDRVRWIPRRLQYPYAALHALATYTPSAFELSVDGRRTTYWAATVVVANSGYYGNGMRIAPDASVDDGVLDVVVLEATSRRAMIRAFPKVYSGEHVDLDEVTVLTGTRVEIRASPAVAMGGDGEPLGPTPGPTSAPAVIEVAASAVRILR
jgi:YegS/Rv2252/BmrU family lipid kinase